MNYVCEHSTEYADVFAGIESARDAPVAFSHLTQARVVLAHQMHAFLVAFLEGRLGRIVQSHDPTRNGFEAWRCLLNEVEPVDRNRGLALLEALIGPSGWLVIGSFLDQVREYERRIGVYEQASGNQFDADLSMATLIRNAPVRWRSSASCGWRWAR